MDPQAPPPQYPPVSPPTQVPNPASPAINIVQEPPQKSPKKLFLIILAGLVITLVTASTSVYFFYYLPRKNTTENISSVSKSVSDFKTSVSQINSLLQDISNLSLGKKGSDSTSLQVSGLAIHPQIASLEQNTKVLGAKTSPQLGPIETDVSSLKKMIISENPFKKHQNSKVAGATTTSESESVINSRKIKDDSSKALDTVDSGTKNLKEVTAKTANLKGVPNKSKAILENITYKESANSYLEEAGKISNYYNTLSSTTIALDSKIRSYQALIAEASAEIGAALTTKNLYDAKDAVGAAQISLNKANQLAQDIKSLGSTLESTGQTSMPNAAQKYQQHNLKVVSSVTDYFTSETEILKKFSTTLDGSITTAQQRPLSTDEVNTLSQAWNTAISQENLADANFTTELTALLGEEINLAASFWQDNGILRLSTSVNGDIDTYQKALNDLKTANKIPFQKTTN